MSVAGGESWATGVAGFFVRDPSPAPVAVARNACSFFIAGLLASTVTRAGKHSVELAADHLFDELTRPSAHLGLDWIKPVVEKILSPPVKAQRYQEPAEYRTGSAGNWSSLAKPGGLRDIPLPLFGNIDDSHHALGPGV
jgi:hypothetical protein